MSLLSYTTVHRLCLYIHTYRQNQQPFDINCRLQRHHQWLFNYNKVVLQLGLNLKLNKASLLYLLPVHKVVHYWLKFLRSKCVYEKCESWQFFKVEIFIVMSISNKINCFKKITMQSSKKLIFLLCTYPYFALSGVTVMLALTMFQQTVSETMPVTSLQVPLLGNLRYNSIYNLYCILLSFWSI